MMLNKVKSLLIETRVNLVYNFILNLNIDSIFGFLSWFPGINIINELPINHIV